MDRRKFIKSSSLLTLPLLLKSCDWLSSEEKYQISIHSDANTGHLLRQSQKFPLGERLSTQTLIAGGGIAGLSAAISLANKDFLLFELSDQLGGSSSASSFNGIHFSQGAHYELAYPEGYGEDVIQLLKDLDIISYQPWNNSWSFKDREHIIFNRSKNQCFDHGEIRKDVLPEGKLKQDFLKLISQFQGKLHLPTRLIEKKLQSLNELSFHAYLTENLILTSDFILGLDYHMKDDYGAGIASISALSGIHYFMCRPYYTQVVELFSPPEGNRCLLKK